MATQMGTTKNKRNALMARAQPKKQDQLQKRKVPLQWYILYNSAPNNTKTLPEIHLLVIIDHMITDFYPWGSLYSQNNILKKDVAKHNQLRLDLGLSSCEFRLWISHVLLLPLADAAALSLGSSRENLITIRTRTTITSPQISAYMPFSMTNFTMRLKTCPTMATYCEAYHRSLWNQTVRKNMIGCNRIPKMNYGCLSKNAFEQEMISVDLRSKNELWRTYRVRIVLVYRAFEVYFDPRNKKIHSMTNLLIWVQYIIIFNLKKIQNILTLS
jgi:hypothetical protein